MSKSPKLRFKEFSGDWEKKKLGKITKLTDGVHFTPTYVESGVPFWSVETVVSNAKPKYITEEAHKEAIKRCYPQVDDILLTRIGTLAKPKLIDWNEEFSIYVSLALIKASTNYNSKFARYYFETEYYQKDFLSKSLLTATPKKINMEDLKQTNIKLPSKEEQEKIASFFSLIDDKISLQGEKVEALKDYKKGMMQKIFSRELRFKDDEGRDYPEWEEKKLGDIALICTGKKDTQDKVDNGKYPFFVRSQIIERINSYSYDGEAILTAGDGVGVGKVFHYMNGKFDYHQRVYKISDFSEDTYGRYVYEYFRVNFIREVTKYTAKTSVDSVRMEMITKMKIPYPVLDEQIKIANVLSAIDSKIDKEQEKLDSLNEYKKGLLQQMFI